MSEASRQIRRIRCRQIFCVVPTLAVLMAVGGCRTAQHQPVAEPTPGPQQAVGQFHSGPPRELSKVVLPTYRIEPPDILMIDALHIVPRPPYQLRTLDALSIEVQGTLPDSPIAGVFPVEPGGLVHLGSRYGSARVAGMTVDQAKRAIEEHLRAYLREPVVSVALAAMASQQQIAGEHLVSPDGTVTLGGYGSVPVVGMTITEAKAAIERHLAQFLEHPEVSVDVFAYNSKVYYVVTQGAGLGDGVYRFPVTGNETVLDAISQINGLEQVSSKRIWIARPTVDPSRCQVLPVSWDAITAQASTSTNYQVLPGDRVFIAEDKLIAFDTNLGKLIAPIERIMGFTLLGTGTATRLSGPVLRGGGNPSTNF
ncbi:MAG: polysaccharide biosynthesis/export family protein [Pirellulales bacterium]|nr:polysaccharide biosynthesis/export family protein [Pirellulales bacterium]